MALLSQMEQAHTLRYLRHAFTQYYQKAKLALPPRFNHREWGFIPWGEGGMHRHMRFDSSRSLSAHLARRAPAHAYHSVAYYHDPGAAKMVEKQWQGADLIFDLDADHMEAPPGTSFAQLMDRTLVQTRRLVEDFLLGDLGLDARWMKVYFSGGRGYHIHVRDPQLLGLDSHGRREIVDYIIGQGLDADRMLIKTEKNPKRKRGSWHIKMGEHVGGKLPSDSKYDNVKVIYSLPPIDTPGWPGRISKSIQKSIKRIANPKEQEYRKTIQAIQGVSKRNIDNISKLERAGKSFDKIWQSSPKVLQNYWLKEEAISLEKGQTDEPVTTDTHRLIRLPGSLHGGTGLAVVPVDIENISAFDPYQEALAFDETPIRLRVGERPGKVKLKGELYEPAPGEVLEIPQFAAIYLLCRKWATLALSHKEARS